MAGWNGSGGFTFTYNWVNDAANGIPITATRMDGQFNDCITGFQNCITRDAQGVATADIPFPFGIKVDTLNPYTALGPVLVSAGQLKWPASDNPSTNANTMDDYEEGTWTPVFSAVGAPTGVVYALQTGWYQKVGNKVFCAFEMVLTNAGSGGSGNVLMTGLPFTVGSTASISRSFSPCYFDGQTLVTGTGLAIQPVASSTTAILAMFGSGATGANLQWADSSNTLDVRGTLVFNV